MAEFSNVWIRLGVYTRLKAVHRNTFRRDQNRRLVTGQCPRGCFLICFTSQHLASSSQVFRYRHPSPIHFLLYPILSPLCPSKQSPPNYSVALFAFLPEHCGPFHCFGTNRTTSAQSMQLKSQSVLTSASVVASESPSYSLLCLHRCFFNFILFLIVFLNCLLCPTCASLQKLSRLKTQKKKKETKTLLCSRMQFILVLSKTSEYKYLCSPKLINQPCKISSNVLIKLKYVKCIFFASFEQRLIDAPARLQQTLIRSRLAQPERLAAHRSPLWR